MYDGYIFQKPYQMPVQPNNDSETTIHIFNPNSVVKAVTRRKYENYWVATSALEAITLYIDANIAGIQDDIKVLLKGEKDIEINVLRYNNMWSVSPPRTKYSLISFTSAIWPMTPSTKLATFPMVK